MLRQYLVHVDGVYKGELRLDLGTLGPLSVRDGRCAAYSMIAEWVSMLCAEQDVTFDEVVDHQAIIAANVEYIDLNEFGAADGTFIENTVVLNYNTNYEV